MVLYSLFNREENTVIETLRTLETVFSSLLKGNCEISL